MVMAFVVRFFVATYAENSASLTLFGVTIFLGTCVAIAHVSGMKILILTLILTAIESDVLCVLEISVCLALV